MELQKRIDLAVCLVVVKSKEELVLSANQVGDKMKTDFVKGNQVKSFL